MSLFPVMERTSIDGLLLATDLSGICKVVRRLGRRFVGVEGFTGSGKSTLAESLADRLKSPWMELDSFLSDDPTSLEIQDYVARLDRRRLQRRLESAQGAVIEGILLRDALQGIVSRVDMTIIYLARCSTPAGILIWHDGIRIVDGDPADEDGWLERAELEYHRNARPHLDADIIVVREEP